MKSTKLLLLAVIVIIFSACSSDEPDDPISDFDTFLELDDEYVYLGNAYFKGNKKRIKDIAFEVNQLSKKTPTNIVKVHLNKPGTLAASLNGHHDYMTALKVSGPMNEWDLAYIAKFAKMRYLLLLDLSDATFKNNIFPDRAFKIAEYNGSCGKNEVFSLVICHIKLPKKTSTIGYHALANLLITDIELPDKLKLLHGGCFNYTPIMNGEIVIPDKVTDIPDYAFHYNYYWWYAGYKSDLDRIYIPSSVKKIHSYAFSVLNAREVIFNEGLEEIGYFAFEWNTTVESIKIPSTVKRLGYGAFKDNTNLKSVYCLNPIPPKADAEGCEFITCYHAFGNDLDIDLTLYVPKGSREAYLNAPCWQDFKEIIEIE